MKEFRRLRIWIASLAALFALATFTACEHAWWNREAKGDAATASALAGATAPGRESPAGAPPSSSDPSRESAVSAQPTPPPHGSKEAAADLKQPAEKSPSEAGPTGKYLEEGHELLAELGLQGSKKRLVHNNGEHRKYETQEGKVSLYRLRQKTASGEQYNPQAMTAAHKKLPFGTIVRVTRKDTNDSVVVRINDRGPFVRGRIIDISSAAAHKLDLHDDGVAPVVLEVLAYPEKS